MKLESSMKNSIIMKDNSENSAIKSDYSVYIRVKENVLATHRELAMLRHCSDLLSREPSRMIHIVADGLHKHSDFYRNTLIHQGVADAQISVNCGTWGKDSKLEGIWLFVAGKTLTV